MLNLCDLALLLPLCSLARRGGCVRLHDLHLCTVLDNRKGSDFNLRKPCCLDCTSMVQLGTLYTALSETPWRWAIQQLIVQREFPTSCLTTSINDSYRDHIGGLGTAYGKPACNSFPKA